MAGEMGLLVFGIYLVYKLRNANSDVHKEKLALCAPIFIELLVSGCTYSLRHAFWRHLGSNQLLALYFIRCQLTVTVTLALVVVPKVSSAQAAVASSSSSSKPETSSSNQATSEWMAQFAAAAAAAAMVEWICRCLAAAWGRRISRQRESHARAKITNQFRLLLARSSSSSFAPSLAMSNLQE